MNYLGVSSDSHVIMIMQGSGTFGVESVFQSSMTKDSQCLVIENGAYGSRMSAICTRLGFKHKSLLYDEEKAVDVNKLEQFLSSNTQKFTHVVLL